MDRLAGSFLSNGDVANASSLYNSLEKLNPTKYSRMARMCRVLCSPQSVPLPFRFNDICDALLDPLVPPEVLLRETPEGVQKSFQRLAVCVHPDKNPNPRANDAFLRLTLMKEKALQLLRDRTGLSEGVVSAAASAGGDGTGSAAPTSQRTRGAAAAGAAANSGNKSRKPKNGSGGGGGQAAATKRTPPPPFSPATPAPFQAPAATSHVPDLRTSTDTASTPPTLDHLRNAKITLSCFKRKDIAEDFEIFSATQRQGTSSAFDSSDASLQDCSGSDHLAATVPVLPTTGKWTPPSYRRYPPLRPAGAEELPRQRRMSHSATPTVRATAAAATPTTGATKPSTPAAAPAASPAFPGGPSRSDAAASKDGQRPPNTAPATAPIAASPSISTPTASSPANLPLNAPVYAGDGAAGVASTEDAIRHQIDQTCQRLQEMRLRTTNVRFTLDLSFQAYQRTKEAPAGSS